ncbi:aa3-type cytochrome c oxidase subunit IV [Phenylobacterium kunshanense]|uniref:Aa3-type cytochrome c oxidase subunit IV n=1 Tax=Phenylobacterium kunshanense TaxID=1445034 RepID=A0A328BCG2_9CAUL|nr:aa3-type cytochrome c oxidase subunit IV [Phenylobacterium kunshanense]RAK64429.1 aa3-type cytochrome c oxidase subunit IV [Phenylobacterium kunshanense]
MAGDTSDYQRGAMEIAEQTSTYNLVMGMTKWGSLYLSAFLLLLVLWFCVPTAGFFAGLIAAVVMIAAGTVVLRDKKDAAAH